MLFQIGILCYQAFRLLLNTDDFFPRFILSNLHIYKNIHNSSCKHDALHNLY